jgi:predicted nucleotidyltransferase component of viral defense system
MEKLKQQFLEVSNALELGNPAIIEKDYWVVALLAELSNAATEHHQMVFSGGTALAKSNVKILRMSEDVDIKLIPTQAFNELSRAKRKAVRKTCIDTIEQAITQSEQFTVETRVVRDEYRYVEFELRYPQQFSQAPCLRPIIKLELMETIPLLEVESRSIQSLVAELYQLPQEVSAFDCVSIHATLVEKVISMLRRTMLVKRNTERKDDAALVRHIYDVHCIESTHHQDIESLAPLFDTVLQEDISRFGNQHAELVANPKQELKLGLQELEDNQIFRQRFQNFVTPMVFNTEPHDFDTCFVSFKRIAESLIKTIRVDHE